MPINGLLIINKPTEMTSHDVVAILRRKLNTKKIGHTGTLDPMATGVLPICIGRATKLVDYLVEKNKTYRCEFVLGKATDTQDIWGSVTEECDVPVLTEENILSTIKSFEGHSQQIPPMYSAIKVNGQKLVDLARKGIEIERQPRPIVIHEIKDIVIQDRHISMTVSCSKGTYIRTLCYDISRALGTVGCMTALERTLVSPYTIQEAVSLEEISIDNIEKWLRPMDEAMARYPSLYVKADSALLKKIENGWKLDYQKLANQILEDSEEVFYRIYVNDIFYGIGEKSDDKILMKKRLKI